MVLDFFLGGGGIFITYLQKHEQLQHEDILSFLCRYKEMQLIEDLSHKESVNNYDNSYGEHFLLLFDIEDYIVAQQYE